MSAADIHEIRTIGTVVLHPDSGKVVYAVGWADPDTDSNRSQLHVHDGTGSRQLTRGHADGSPRFSPSGDRFAFIRSEPKSKPVLMTSDWGPGEPVAVGEFPDGVIDFRWLDGQRLVILATERPEDQVGVDDEELERRPRTVRTLDYRFNGRGWTHDRKRQIFVIDLESGRQRRLSNPAFDHSALAVDPAGDLIATVVASDDDSDLTGVNHIWTCGVDGGNAVQITSVAGSWADLCWHPDGPLVAVGSLTADRVGFYFLHRFDRGADRSWAQPVRLGDADINVDVMAGISPVVVDDAILAPGDSRGATVIDRYPLDGSAPTRVRGGRELVGSFDSSRDGALLVASIASPTRPAELWDLSNAEPVRLTFLNDELLGELDLSEPETVSIESTDGATVEAWIHRPPESAPSLGQPGPGLVYIHGGPLAQYGYGFFDEFQLAAAEGFTVIAGNPRGGDGYGEEWATCIVGELGQRDWADVTAIADHLVSLPEVDADRIGIGGGSYGGYMSAWAIGHTDRFRAALVERAVINWENFAGTTDIPYFLPIYMKATNESDVEAIRRQSPITFAANATTPTLILHSEDDFRCPIEQAEQLFAALRRNGCDATFVRFPGENHELSRSGSPRHRVERLDIIHEFFRSHLT